MASKKFQLNKSDLSSIAWTLGLSALAAICTKLLELVPGIDFGANSPIIVAVLTTILKTLQKTFSGAK